MCSQGCQSVVSVGIFLSIQDFSDLIRLKYLSLMRWIISLTFWRCCSDLQFIIWEEEVRMFPKTFWKYLPCHSSFTWAFPSKYDDETK